MELRLGFMSKKELAEFFHKSATTFRNHKDIYDKYCVILGDYAVFEKVRGGINILSIHNNNNNSYDDLPFDLDKGIDEAILEAKHSKYYTNGIICTAGYVLDYLMRTQATTRDRELINKDYVRITKNLKQRISYRLRKKYPILGEEVLKKYFEYVDEDKSVEYEYKGKGLIPLIYEKRNEKKIWREITKEEKKRLDELVDEESKNNDNNSRLALFHLIAGADEYKGSEKVFVAESKKLCRPFYRAVERFNKEFDVYYIYMGSIIFKEGKVYKVEELINEGEFDF